MTLLQHQKRKKEKKKKFQRKLQINYNISKTYHKLKVLLHYTAKNTCRHVHHTQPYYYCTAYMSLDYILLQFSHPYITKSNIHKPYKSLLSKSMCSIKAHFLLQFKCKH